MKTSLLTASVAFAVAKLNPEVRAKSLPQRTHFVRALAETALDSSGLMRQTPVHTPHIPRTHNFCHLPHLQATQGPCDIFGAGGTPCVAAHSLVRALYGSYTGPLYQVLRQDTNATQDIGLLYPGGYVNASAQDAFCNGAPCVVQRIYDQSPMANHLDLGPPGGAVPRPDQPVNATRHPISIGGYPAYGAYFEGGMGYRIDKTTGVATGNDPETIYMITSGTHFNGGCCFDYGNAEVRASMFILNIAA
jgi:hypothetical protein